MWAWEVLRRVVRNTDRVVQNTDSLVRSVDVVGRTADSIVRNAESIVRTTESIDRNAETLPAVARCLNEIADLQKAQLVMLREQSESLHRLTPSIGRLIVATDETGKLNGMGSEAAAGSGNAPDV
jgi:hypothetical protein